MIQSFKKSLHIYDLVFSFNPRDRVCNFYNLFIFCALVNVTQSFVLQDSCRENSTKFNDSLKRVLETRLMKKL